MKSLIFFTALLCSLSSFAQDLTVVAEGDKTDTSVVVTPLEEAPKDIPLSGKSKKTDPKWWKISLFGLGLAPLEFFVSTAIHEGSHATVAAANGADITAYSPYPHKHEGSSFVFGDVHWRGSLSPGAEAATLAAPMILDTAVLGTYGGLVLANALPENKYAKMAMWVFAAGNWVDMANHLVGRNEHTDTRRLEQYFQDEHGLSTMQSRLVVRGSQAAVLAAGGFFLYKGIRDIFKKNSSEVFMSKMAAVDEYDRQHAKPRRPKKSEGFIKDHNLILSPSVSTEGGGLSFGGTF